MNDLWAVAVICVAVAVIVDLFANVGVTYHKARYPGGYWARRAARRADRAWAREELRKGPGA